MKKYFKISLISCFLFAFLILLVGCNNEVTFSISFSEINLVEGETKELEYTTNAKNPTYKYSLSNEIITIDENDVIKAVGIGTCEVTVTMTSGQTKKELTFIVNVSEAKPTKLETEGFLTFELGSTNQLDWVVLPNVVSQEVEFKFYDQSIISISEDGLVKALSLGKTSFHIISKLDSTIRKLVQVTVVRPDIVSIEGETKVTVEYESSINLSYTINPLFASPDVKFEVENEKIASVSDDGVLTGCCPGSTKVKIISLENSNIYLEVDVTVNGTKASKLECDSEVTVDLGSKAKIDYVITPSNAYQGISYSYDDALEINENNILMGKKVGTYYLTLSTIDGSNLSKKIKVNVKGSSTPIFVLDDVEKDLTINWNEEFDPLFGIRAFDGEDGELEIEIKNEVDTSTYGMYILEYIIRDSDNNELTMTRNIEVIWNYDVTFIGHGGCYYGAFNSEEAIIYAAKVLKYQAIEIDLKQTKDGVFVLSHDPSFGGYQLEDYTFDELKDIEITETRKSGIPGSNGSVVGTGTYKAKLCTLERYLEICKEYNIKAVIELKTSKGISNWCELNTPDASRMADLIKQIEDAGMINNTILLSSQYECLAWTRKNGYEFMECQYLVSCCENEEYLNICKKYDLDISMNVRDGIVNSDEWLKKYKDAGLKIAAYTFEEYASYEVLQSYIDRGFDYVTTDWHVITGLQLPEKEQ